jgi:hypothetical protein
MNIADGRRASPPENTEFQRAARMPMPLQRDLRIDFFRGLALLIVVADHIEGCAGKSVVREWTLVSLGFSDAAEVFVFLSGYVFALAYSKTLDQHGFVATLTPLRVVNEPGYVLSP